MKKSFGTLAVLGVYVGRVLEDRGFGQIHEVMDHLYPGIMTLGAAAMMDNAAIEIAKQHPEVKVLGACTDENWREFGIAAEMRLGPRLDIEGPIEVSKETMDAAFARFRMPE